jgi:SAM-dependent methyltransferase
MIAEIREIIQYRIAQSPNFSSLRAEFGAQWRADRPSDALEYVARLCRLALPSLREPTSRTAAAGADALLHFLAYLPADLTEEIRALPAFRSDIKRAWEEPCADAYVALCNTVHDVWAHIGGLEAREDHDILAELLRSRPCFALDYGSGAGHFALALASQGVDVDVVEIDQVKLRFLLYRAAAAGLSDHIRPGIHRTHYDLALAVNVLDHLEEPVEAVKEIARYISPGGLFYTLAEFPPDGYHQADDAAIRLCAKGLWEYFMPSSDIAQRAEILDAFVRRKAAADLTHLGDLTPCLHIRAEFWQSIGVDDELLITPTFYAKPCMLSKARVSLCQHFNGRRSLKQLADDLGIEFDDLVEFCISLEESRHLYWVEPIMVAPNIASV